MLHSSNRIDFHLMNKTYCLIHDHKYIDFGIFFQSKLHFQSHKLTQNQGEDIQNLYPKKRILNFLPVFKVVEIPSERSPLTQSENALAIFGEFGKIRRLSGAGKHFVLCGL